MFTLHLGHERLCDVLSMLFLDFFTLRTVSIPLNIYVKFFWLLEAQIFLGTVLYLGCVKSRLYKFLNILF